MCGISGIVAKTTTIDSENEIRRMNDRIRHRGPDGEGIYIYRNIALGHRRLAILEIGRASCRERV